MIKEEQHTSNGNDAITGGSGANNNNKLTGGGHHNVIDIVISTDNPHHPAHHTLHTHPHHHQQQLSPDIDHDDDNNCDITLHCPSVGVGGGVVVDKHETLSVIVQPQDDSRDSTSQLLSPGDGGGGKLTPTTNDLIDTSDFRALHEPTYQTLTSVNGRMSPPGFSPNSSYATLTPLQPLPPISTMSDKFAYGSHANSVSGSFTVMQNQSLGNLTLSGLAGVNAAYAGYDKLASMGGMSPPSHHNYSTSPTSALVGGGGGGVGGGGGGGVMSQQASPLSPQSTYSQNGGLHSPQKSMSPNGYESPYGGHHRDSMCRQQPGGSLQSVASPQLSPQSMHSPMAGGGGMSCGGGVTGDGSLTGFDAVTLNGLAGQTTIGAHATAAQQCSPLAHSTPPGLVQISHMHGKYARAQKLFDLFDPACGLMVVRRSFSLRK